MKLWIEEALGFHLHWWQRLWLLPTDRKWRRQYSEVLRIVEKFNACGEIYPISKEETKMMSKMMTVDEVLEAAVKTRDYFYIRSVLAGMEDEGLITPDGKFYAQSLLQHAEGRDCYQTVQEIVATGVVIAAD